MTRSMITTRQLTLPSPPSPEDVFAQLEAEEGSVWLDDGRLDSGWTIIGWAPERVCTEGAHWPSAGRRLTGSASPSDVPFTTGCIGYIGYHSAHHISTIPVHVDCPEPEIWLAHYPQSLCFRHHDQTWFATGNSHQQQVAQRLLECATKLPAPRTPVATSSHCRWKAHDYEHAIAEILQLLHDGDCYQVNLSRAVHVEGNLDPWSSYRRLRRASHAGHGALLNLGNHIRILSSSPELLLSVNARQALSVPIKGTRPRGATPNDDRRLIDELTQSPKELAELTMIVDLVRNDLGRVSIPGTVQAAPRRIDSYAYVHHASQAVSSTLSQDADSWDALAALFPPGSVTGAPKLRACQRIFDLEPESRGVYCGAIGFASASGQAQWSVAIRTAVHTRAGIRFHVGGGIVEASIPNAEWQETIHKAKAMAEAFTGS